MAQNEYKRLTRWRRRGGKFFEGLSTHSSLWLGNDHLLCIDTNRFSEMYKRFYFRDIQAITIRKTKRREIWNIVLLMILLVSITAAISAFDSSLYAWAFMTSPIGLILLLNNILGPTCTVHLRTAVQVEELPPLSRVRRTQQFMARVRPLIVAAQEHFVPEETSTPLGGELQSPPSEPAEPPAIATGPPHSTN